MGRDGNRGSRGGNDRVWDCPNWPVSQGRTAKPPHPLFEPEQGRSAAERACGPHGGPITDIAEIFGRGNGRFHPLLFGARGPTIRSACLETGRIGQRLSEQDHRLQAALVFPGITWPTDPPINSICRKFGPGDPRIQTGDCFGCRPGRARFLISRSDRSDSYGTVVCCF